MAYFTNLRELIQRRVRKNNLAFLHVPKTGGTYLTQRETSHNPVLPVHYLGHTYVVDRKDVVNPLYYLHSPQHHFRTTLVREVQSYVIISTVRNIFSWLVSYAWHAGGWNPKYRDPNHYDFSNANKGFEYLLKVLANREDIWPNRKFIHCQFFCNNGKLIVDWMNRNECLDNDLESLAHKYHLPFLAQEKQRVGHKTDYRTYYTGELIDIVYETWGRELNLFGHEFDGLKHSTARLRQSVNGKFKKSIRYVLDKDELFVDGMLVGR